MKGWHQFSFKCEQQRVDLLEDALMELGSVSVTLTDAEDQPLLEPLPGETPTWDHSIITVLFEQDHQADSLSSSISSLLTHTEKPSLNYEWIEDQAWERAWMDEFKPMQFGNSLWVVPSHLSPPDTHATNMVLDPGLAFGTGTHPTTALCLTWLDAQDLTQKNVIDFGCGSGVLAIAAQLLGANKTYVTDIDPQAIEATHANAELNHVSDGIVVLNTQQTPDTPVDIFIANILAGPLEELAEHFTGMCAPGTKIALSGILKEQAEQVSTHYQQWFDMDEPIFQDDWTLLTGTKI